MKKESDYRDGQFCWVDLQTTDTDEAKRFYGALMGWDFEDRSSPMGFDFTRFLMHGEPVAGMGPMPKAMREAGAPATWSSYVCAADAEAKAKACTELGGKVLMPPMQLMNDCIIAMLQDPTGATIGLWQPLAHRGAAWVNSVGGFCWNELYTHDLEASRSFYEELFGWTFATSGHYTEITLGERANGGMMKIEPEWGDMPPMWTPYFTVQSIDDSVAKALTLGGKNFVPKMEAQGVGQFAGLTDPQAGAFMAIEMSVAPEPV